MKGHLLADIQSATEIFAGVRRARKNGYRLFTAYYKPFSFVRSGGFYNTVEGCTLSHCGEEIAGRAELAFDQLSEEGKKQLSFAPKDGEYADRAQLWGFLLRCELTPKQYHIAMAQILHWYIQIKRGQIGHE